MNICVCGGGGGGGGVEVGGGGGGEEEKSVWPRTSVNNLASSSLKSRREADAPTE